MAAKGGRNKTIDTPLSEGRIYLDRCISVAEKQSDLSRILDKTIIGNMLDRGLRSSVIDFLDFHIGPHHWPAFNIADSAICVAVAFMLFQSFFLEKRKKEK